MVVHRSVFPGTVQSSTGEHMPCSCWLIGGLVQKEIETQQLWLSGYALDVLCFAVFGNAGCQEGGGSRPPIFTICRTVWWHLHHPGETPYGFMWADSKAGMFKYIQNIAHKPAAAGNWIVDDVAGGDLLYKLA